ncbi:MAG: sulfurtransferase TusA family protein [Promethearchaeota archaeon]
MTSNKKEKPKLTIDTIGLYCPVPLFKTREGISSIQPGEILKVLADDPAAREDITRFVKKTGHELVKIDELDDTLVFWIKRIK